VGDEEGEGEVTIPLKEPEIKYGFPSYNPPVFEFFGVRYLKEAGVAMISRPNTELASVSGFLEGFDVDLGFGEYLNDPYRLDDGAEASKFAGQLCYLSFGEKRTWNKDADRYFENILASGHGSVLEHANYGFLFWGVDRSLTHELVRHRHESPSQLSQRYCGGKTLRFVERPEYQVDRLPADASDELKSYTRQSHWTFEKKIQDAASRYEGDAIWLSRMQEAGHPLLQGGSKTEERKHLNQVARENLPNSTEAPIVVTGNARAWRGFLDQRATKHADVPIRELAVKVLRCLQYVSPLLFGDYEITQQEDGTEVATTEYRKV
jgi:thymidylate synthase (FAD)